MSFVQDVLSRGRHYNFTGKIHSGGGFMGVKMTSSQTPKDISRRKFMTIAGGAAGLATMAAMGLSPRGECSPNISKFDADKMIDAENETDVLVIGGGMAGLFAAVKAHDAGAKVIIVSKGRVGSSGQTPFAKGIFAFDPESSNISLDEFVDTVSRSALGTNNSVYTRKWQQIPWPVSMTSKNGDFLTPPCITRVLTPHQPKKYSCQRENRHHPFNQGKRTDCRCRRFQPG